MAISNNLQNPIIITTHGTDGACSGAMLLKMLPKAEIYITSARRIGFTLEDIFNQATRPYEIHICGVGVGDNTESVVETLQTMKRKRFKVYWYCGRGYLDSHFSDLNPVCRPVFIECESNAMAIYKHHNIRNNERVELLLTLAQQFVSPSLKRKKEHDFWHDLIKSSASRYFKYEDRKSFIQSIRKLAGLIPITDGDRNDVESFRRIGTYSVPLGDSKPMKKVRNMIQRLAPLDEPVLIVGPTGSGKEAAARLLHEASGRHGLFVPINCAILSTNNDLAHDRLFGHVSGAFTGAKESQPGAFEIANKGTLFLDEIAELPLPVQTQLLRVLEEESIIPLGTMKSLPVNVRIIAATNQNLSEMVKNGQFRIDLYHRLNVLKLRIPSLLERQRDMKSIANNVIYELNQKGHTLFITPADWKAIYQFPWHGNIRQFINILKRAAYMEMPVREVLNEESMSTSHDPHENITPQLLAEYLQFRPQSIEEVLPEEEIRKSYMKHVFDLFDGNIAHTAKALNVAKNTLKKWVHER